MSEFAVLEIGAIEENISMGITESERSKLQPVRLGIVLEVEWEKASKSDDIRDAVDYDAVEKLARGILRNSSSNLLENLGQKLLEVLYSLPGVRNVEISLEKPQALTSGAFAKLTCQKKC